MARLPRQNKILAEDFPDQKSWIPKLLLPLNGFFEDVISALNKNLTFKENMAGDILTATADGVYPIDLKWTNRAKPIAAWIGQCREISGTHTTITTALYLDWEMTPGGAFRINNIAGLSGETTTNKFEVTIIAITG